MKISEMLSLELTDLALGGKAIGRHQGRVVFVDRGVPGDRVECRIVKVKPSFAEARLESVITASPHRVAAPCPHVPICGGCRFQDLDYAEQCRAKQRQVRDALVHLGGIPDPQVAPITPAPEVFGYRNKMEFSFHPGSDGQPVLGLHERGAFDRIFAVETCLLPSRLTVELVRMTQEFALRHGWRAYHPRRHEGVVRFLTVRHLPTTDQCAVHLIASQAGVPALSEWASQAASLSPAVRSVTLGINRSKANIAFAEEERVLAGGAAIMERIHGLSFEASANAFLQTNSRQAEALYASALAAADLRGSERVLDLYCGTGTLTLLLARAAREVVGVESVADAMAAAERNADQNGIRNVRFVHGEARRILREWARGERTGAVAPDVVTVDPPRAGLHPRVVARVADLGARRIVYVSCNPATLARDTKDLIARGYRLDRVAPFDMFPHTPHIECVATFSLAAEPAGVG